MLQTIQGYFQDDKFVPLHQAKIPSHVEVYVVVTSKPVSLKFSETEHQSPASQFPLFGCAKNKGGWIADDFDATIRRNEGLYMMRYLHNNVKWTW